MWLLCASLIFYAMGNLTGLPYLLTVIVLTYVSSGWILSGKCLKKTIYIVTILFLIGLLFYYKWSDPNALPIGISFYTFQAISYLSDIRMGRLKQRTSLLSFALYLSFFPQLIAGPIVRFNNVEHRLSRRDSTSLRERRNGWIMGSRRFVLGLSKKILLADQFAGCIALWQNQPDTILLSWMHAFAYMLQIYFDFSGYSDMAIGLGQLFGFSFPENFNLPYRSVSMTEFWRRWHITLGAWFRDYLYVPLGGSRNPRHNTLKTIRNLLIVFLLTGLWHGIGLNFLLWGLAYGILLSLEKFFGKPKGVMGHCYVLLLTLLLFVLFESPTLPLALHRYQTMFGLRSVTFCDSSTLFLGADCMILFLLGSFFAVYQSPATKKRLYNLLADFSYPILLVLCLAVLVAGTSQPFLYFQF